MFKNELQSSSVRKINKKYKKNNSVRTSLLTITYNEIKTYLDKSQTMLNNQTPSQIAKNFSVKLYINNPIVHGNSNKEQVKETHIIRRCSDNVFGSFEVQNTEKYQLLMSRKKTIADKKLQNSKKNFHQVTQLNINDCTSENPDDLCNFYVNTASKLESSTSQPTINVELP